jgi:hypothetical protein
MSRTAAALMLVSVSAVGHPAVAQVRLANANEAMERYVDAVSVDPDCRRNVKPDEITVCGRRDADRYRLPLVIPTEGAPNPDNVPAQRAYLVRTMSPCEKRGPFLIGCGSVGVSAGIGFDGKVIAYRKLAP